MSFLQKSRPAVPGVVSFHFDATFGTRQSQKFITEMANEVAHVLAEVSRILVELISTGQKTLNNLVKSDSVYTIEEEQKLVSNYQEIELAMFNIYTQLVEMEDSAVCDSDLFGRNESTVVDAYKSVIAKMKKLIKITQDIRWGVMDRVEDHGKVVGDPMTIDELIKSLG